MAGEKLGGIDQKAFLEGFLQYLQSYYGAAGTPKPSTMYSNKPNIPLFDKTGDNKFPEMPPQPQGMGQPGMGQPGMGQAALPQETGGGDLSSQLNTMFPQRNMGGMN